MTKPLTIWLWVIPLLVQAQKTDSALGLRIRGVLIDHATLHPLDAGQLFAKTANGRVNVSVSGDSGKFSGVLPRGTTALLVERASYRPQIIPIRLSASENAQIIMVLIPLISIDKQNRDTPYLQTEQTSYVQRDSAAIQSTQDTERIQHSTFLITDAIQNKPISATVCFFYTKTGTKQCLGTDSKGWFRVDFKQKDIVAIEVSATGYQSYAGNLVVDQLDGRLLQHKIRMQRELTLFTVHAPEATHSELRTKTKTISLHSVPEDNGQFVTYDLLPGNYELFTRYKTHVVRQTIQLSTGLNFINATSPPKDQPVTPSTSGTTILKSVITGMINKPVLMLPDSIPIIYFGQGSYQLRPDSQDILKQVVGYMKEHPKYILQIVGHTDNVGNAQINQSLSIYRALVTATFLTRQGVTDGQLVKDGVGSNQPIMPNDIEANRALNRRVSLKLITAQ